MGVEEALIFAGGLTAAVEEASSYAGGLSGDNDRLPQIAASVALVDVYP
jgi:hypothetical protein